jgi:hypothetical protein
MYILAVKSSLKHRLRLEESIVEVLLLSRALSGLVNRSEGKSF